MKKNMRHNWNMRNIILGAVILLMLCGCKGGKRGELPKHTCLHGHLIYYEGRGDLKDWGKELEMVREMEGACVAGETPSP